MGFVLVLEQGRIKPRVQVGFLGVRIYRYRPLTRLLKKGRFELHAASMYLSG
jgi:hypothetical protein